ncbi:MAG: CinA family protein, partial [Candidatus Omnitrophica bacterium]|nr:CinA family protein [Candidatus Omnitrophota bacterium]
MIQTLTALHKVLLKKHFSIATAESCTGGLLGFMLTSIPGSSAYFKSGLITYSNLSKQRLLKIPAKIILKYGAVSREVAKKMAQNVRALNKTDIGVGITGIAGPSGGSGQKPLGTVYIAVQYNGKTECQRFIFKGSR